MVSRKAAESLSCFKFIRELQSELREFPGAYGLDIHSRLLKKGQRGGFRSKDQLTLLYPSYDLSTRGETCPLPNLTGSVDLVPLPDPELYFFRRGKPSD